MSERKGGAPQYMTSADLSEFFQISLREAQYLMQDFDRARKTVRFGRAVRVDIGYVADLMCLNEIGARKVDKVNILRSWLSSRQVA